MFVEGNFVDIVESLSNSELSNPLPFIVVLEPDPELKSGSIFCLSLSSLMTVFVCEKKPGLSTDLVFLGFIIDSEIISELLSKSLLPKLSFEFDKSCELFSYLSSSSGDELFSIFDCEISFGSFSFGYSVLPTFCLSSPSFELSEVVLAIVSPSGKVS